MAAFKSIRVTVLLKTCDLYTSCCRVTCSASFESIRSTALLKTCDLYSSSCVATCMAFTSASKIVLFCLTLGNGRKVENRYLHQIFLQIFWVTYLYIFLAIQSLNSFWVSHWIGWMNCQVALCETKWKYISRYFYSIVEHVCIICSEMVTTYPH